MMQRKAYTKKCHSQTSVENCIHTFAGIQLRKTCDDLMNAHGPGYEEPTGIAEITPAYNLPCKYVLHTCVFSSQKIHL